MELYKGKEEEKSDAGVIYDLVLRMMKPYFDKNYILFTDNWFTSPIIMRALADHHVVMCRSVRLNRVGMPTKSLLNKHTLKSMHVHQSLSFTDDDMHETY